MSTEGNEMICEWFCWTVGKNKITYIEKPFTYKYRCEHKPHFFSLGKNIYN